MLRSSLISRSEHARRFSLASSLALPAALALALSTATAEGQTVSDADRAAARELAMQGLQLQQAGDFTGALDRFDRAQAVFSAPTHLLHIAQCEAALGKLVEAAETYRTLVRTPLPANAPPAFVQAQQEGAAELSQVEPRIPAIRVIVRPSVTPNMTIQIDGQPMSSALVGVQRPTDPGPHSVVLLAPGYARAEQRITLKEKEIKDVAFNLGGTVGGYYTPPPASTAPPGSTSTAQNPSSPPPMYTVPPPPEPLPAPEHREARGGFMLGAAAGGLIPGGTLYEGMNASSMAAGGAGLALNGGFRFARVLYFGLTYQHGFLGAGSTLTGFPQGGSADAESNYLGANFSYISNPSGVGFYGELGAGIRWLNLSVKDASGGNNSQALQGGEFLVGAGVHIKLGDWVRLIPLASISAGPFATSSCTGNFKLATPDECNGDNSIQGSAMHFFFFLGVNAFVDFSRKH
jgi:hypothetical protein